MRRGPVLFVILALLFAFGYAAQRTLMAAWHRVTTYAPPVSDAALTESGATPLADRLVLIAVSGLEASDVTLLPSLDWIRRQGGSYHLTVPAPASEAAAAATLLTGAPPEVHGRFLSTPGGPGLTDSLPQAAARAQRGVGGIGAGALGMHAEENWQVPTSDTELVEMARTLVAPGGPHLVLIQVPMPGGKPAADRTALAELDALLVQILEPVDLQSTAVMVVGLPVRQPPLSMMEASVPLVMAGAGIQPEVWGTASLTDVAPTAAALLGIPFPAISQGQPLMEALTAEGRTADVIVSQYLATRRAYTHAALEALGDERELPEPPEARAEAAAYLDQLSELLQQARSAHWRAAAPARLPYLGGLLAVLLLYLALALRQRFGFPLRLGLCTYLAAFHLLLLLQGGGYLTALVSLQAVTPGSFALRALPVALSMGLASLTCGFVAARQGMRRAPFVGAATLHTALTAAVVTAIPAVVLLIIYGRDFPAGLPAPGLVAWFLAAVFQVVVISYLSPIWLVLGVNAARLTQRLWPQRETGDPARKADNVIRLKTIRRHTRK
ncbi:MAG TPA: hypothetical protein VIL07_04895 [Symbiobacteriaceae bacterium]